MVNGEAVPKCTLVVATTLLTLIVVAASKSFSPEFVTAICGSPILFITLEVKSRKSTGDSIDRALIEQQNTSRNFWKILQLQARTNQNQVKLFDMQIKMQITLLYCKKVMDLHSQGIKEPPKMEIGKKSE